MNRIDTQAQVLLTKLDDGYARIDPDDQAAIDTFWITLMNEYEAVCNALQDDDANAIPSTDQTDVDA
jgi:hypothetical protein